MAVIVKETLILIEVKDDLFWDIRDLPTLICLWNDNETKKLEKIGDKFEMEIIKERMNSVNLKYSSVKTIVLTQSHITHTDFKTISNLLSLIEKIMVGDENLMIFTFLQNGFFPKYPWAD